MTFFAVDIAANIEFGHCAYFVGREYAWPHRRKIVKTLAEIPLLMACLEIARRYIIYDSVAKDILACVGSFDVLCVPADDNAKLDFVVQAVTNVKSRPDAAPGSALQA